MPIKKAARNKVPKKRLRSISSSLKEKVKKKFPAKSIKKAQKTRKRSSIELLVYKWLGEAGIEFRKEKVIGRCHVDVFIEPDIVVEINGCYWHRSSCCYPEKTPENLEARMKDIRRYAFLRNKGYEVHTIKECDIKNDPEKVKEMLAWLAKKG